MLDVSELIEEVRSTKKFVKVPNYRFAKQLSRKARRGDINACRKVMEVFYHASPNPLDREHTLAMAEIEKAYEAILDLDFEE